MASSEKAGQAIIATSSSTHQDIENGSTSSRYRTRETPLSVRTQDEYILAQYGKRQQLKRRFKSLSSIGLTSGLMLTWEVVLFSLSWSLRNGGSSGVVYGFIFAWAGAMLQAVVFAEMASMIPLAGGPFNWVAILSPLWCRRFLSYSAGWCTVVAWQVFVTQVVSSCASLVQGIVIMTHSEYKPEKWHATLLFYAIMLYGLFINTYLGRILPRIEALMLIMYILGFFGVIIPLLYLSPKTSAKAVFTNFEKLGGWESRGVTFMVGWVSSVTAFIGNDGSDHIAEEIHQSSAIVPFTIWFSTFLNGLLGFAMLITTLFTIKDVPAVVNSETGWAVMEVFEEALGSLKGGSILIIVIVAVNVFSVSSVMATASRTLWAFSRENALPFSSWIVKVQPKTRIPINAIIVTITFSLLLGLIGLGSTVALPALYSVVLVSYLSSFLLASGVMLHKRLVTPTSEMPWGPFRLHRLGVPLTIAAIIYTIVAFFFAFWPQIIPITIVNMNFSVILFGAMILIGLGFWVFHGRKVYVGPVWEFQNRLGESHDT